MAQFARSLQHISSMSLAKAGEPATNIAAVAAPKSSFLMIASVRPRSKHQIVHRELPPQATAPSPYGRRRSAPPSLPHKPRDQYPHHRSPSARVSRQPRAGAQVLVVPGFGADAKDRWTARFAAGRACAEPEITAHIRENAIVANTLPPRDPDRRANETTPPERGCGTRQDEARGGVVPISPIKSAASSFATAQPRIVRAL
jgi:hypothetical protein